MSISKATSAAGMRVRVAPAGAHGARSTVALASRFGRQAGERRLAAERDNRRPPVDANALGTTYLPSLKLCGILFLGACVESYGTGPVLSGYAVPLQMQELRFSGGLRGTEIYGFFKINGQNEFQDLFQIIWQGA